MERKSIFDGLNGGSQITIDDLLKYNGEEFIKNAYSSILKRTPDPEGFNLYLSQLKTNKLNKIQILGALRYSKEGRKKHAIIKRLFPRYLLSLSYRIPLLGYAMKTAAVIAKLPKVTQKFEQTVEILKQKISELDITLSSKADTQFINNELSKLILSFVGLGSEVSAIVNRQVSIEGSIAGIEDKFSLILKNTSNGMFILQPGEIISDYVIREGIWDDHILEVATEVAKTTKGTAIDVGAHFGLITVALANKFKYVFSFEPNDFNYQILRANISINGLKNVECINNALYSKSLELSIGNNQQQEIPIPLDAHGQFNGSGASNLGAFSFTEHGTSLFKHEARTLDSYNLNDVSFIKIDTQGADGEVILGALDTIKRCTPVIVFEWEKHLSANFSVNFNRLNKELSNIGYDITMLKKHNEKQIDYIARKHE